MNWETVSQQLIWIDYTIAVIVLVSALIGLMRGFVKELSRLLTWLVTVGVCANYAPDFAQGFQKITQDPLGQIALACGALFVAVLLLSSLIQWVLRDLILKDRLSLFDRLLGTLFGFARGLVMITLALVFASATPMPQSSWWVKSAFIPLFQQASNVLKDHLPARWAGYIHH